MSQIWQEILQSNTFNFALLIILLGVVIKTCKLSDKLQAGIDKIKDSINNSALAKENSIAQLQEAEEKVSNIKNEIKELEDKNEEVILNSEEKLKKETEEFVSKIKENSAKAILTKEQEIIAKLSKETVITSIELAKEHIKNLLKKNPSLHKEFIDESLKELDRSTYGQQK